MRFPAALVTAFAFALMQLVSSAITSSVAGFEPTFVLGQLTGTLVAVTGRIGGAILAHALCNTVAVLLTRRH